MTVDRWYFGIPAFANYQEGPSWYTPSDKHSYIVGLKVFLSEAVNGGRLLVFGKPTDTTKNPANLDAVAVFNTGLLKGDGCVMALQDMNIPLAQSSMLALYADLPGATTITVVLDIAEMPTTSSLIGGAGIVGSNASRDAVSRALLPTYLRRFVAQYTSAGLASTYLNMTANAKQIIQPFQQTTPAVADQLNVVSSSALDTAAGIGAKTINFDYWNASWVLQENAGPVSLNGTTPVNIISSYADVYAIKRAWVATVGSLRVNAGHLLFQDDA